MMSMEDLSHLYNDSSAITRLDAREYEYTRRARVREQRALERESRVLARAHRVVIRDQTNESRLMKETLNDLQARTPYFKHLNHNPYTASRGATPPTNLPRLYALDDVMKQPNFLPPIDTAQLVPSSPSSSRGKKVSFAQSSSNADAKSLKRVHVTNSNSTVTFGEVFGSPRDWTEIRSQEHGRVLQPVAKGDEFEEVDVSLVGRTTKNTIRKAKYVSHSLEKIYGKRQTLPPVPKRKKFVPIV